MTRADFQRLAEERLEDAKALLRARRWSGAYYLGGYALECALKSCICRKRRRFEFPDKEFAAKCFTHNLSDLAQLADLKDELKSERKTRVGFNTYWDAVEKWSEKSRYIRSSRLDAEDLLRAVGDEKDGILPWLKHRW
jgi:HEPN domain-containing protein